MTSFNDSLYLNFLTGADQVTPKFQQLIKYGDTLAKKQAMGGNIGGQVDFLNKKYGQNSKELDIVNKSMKQSNQMLKEMGNRFDMNTLSWMFGGMALQMVSMSMVRFLIPAMDKLEKLNTTGAKKIMAMSASFEFLKISMFETLTSLPLFDKFIEFVIQGAIWLADWVERYPALVGVAAVIAGLGATLGTIAIGVGIFMQLEHLLTLMGFSKAGTETGSGVAGGFSKLKTAFGIGLTLAAGIKLYNALTNEETSSWGDVLMTAVMAGLGSALLFNPATGIITGLVVAATMTLDKIKDDKIAARAQESKVNIQRIFNKLGEEGVALDTSAFDKLFSRMLNYTGSSELQKAAENLRTDLALEILDEETYRTRMANLFGTLRKSSLENSPLIGIADLTKEQYGLDTFELLWFDIMTDNLRVVVESNDKMKLAFDNMAIQACETIKNKIITPMDDWEPPDKFVHIYPVYHGSIGTTSSDASYNGSVTE